MMGARVLVVGVAGRGGLRWWYTGSTGARLPWSAGSDGRGTVKNSRESRSSLIQPCG